MNRRVLGLIASVLLASAGTFVLLTYVRGAEERAAAGEQVVEVFVVTEAIERGTPATEIEESVKSTLVPTKVRAEGAVAALADLTDRVAAVDLAPGEQLLDARFITALSLEAETKVEVPDGLLQVTVSLSPERAVGGQLHPGSTVAVLASFDPFSLGTSEPGELPPVPEPDPGPGEDDDSATTGLKTPNSTHLILHKILVTNIQVEQLPAESTRADAATATHDLAPTGNLLVTLAVPAADAERLVFTSEHGAVWLAIEPTDAPEEGTSIQTRGTIYQ